MKFDIGDSYEYLSKKTRMVNIEPVGTGCLVEMTTQQSNNNTIYFRCSVVQ